MCYSELSTHHSYIWISFDFIVSHEITEYLEELAKYQQNVKYIKQKKCIVNVNVESLWILMKQRLLQQLLIIIN